MAVAVGYIPLLTACAWSALNFGMFAIQNAEGDSCRPFQSAQGC